jgi:hypothetical protein
MRALWGVLLLVGSVGALAACGSPQYTYVKNSGEKTYFKVPAGWHKIDQATLDRVLTSEDPDSASAEVRKKISWSIAYDAATDPSANHLLGTGSSQPFVYATIRQLSDSERGVISLNHLRDIFLPVTDQARQTAASQGAPFDDFELLRDQELTPGGGIRGVRETYNYTVPLGGLQTFDLTAYLSDDGHMFLMIVRCTAKCFKQRSGELESIIKSFTVRKQS